MTRTHQNLSETHIAGNNTKELIVRATDCHALRGHRIAHVGIADAAMPYRNTFKKWIGCRPSDYRHR